MNPYFVGFLVPAAVSLLLCKRRNVGRKRGVPAEVGGEPGYAVRNYRFEQPIETHWEGVTTLAELFERSCKEYAHMPLLGTGSSFRGKLKKGLAGGHLRSFIWANMSGGVMLRPLRAFATFHLGYFDWGTKRMSMLLFLLRRGLSGKLHCR
jgi:hypothetical protein